MAFSTPESPGRRIKNSGLSVTPGRNVSMSVNALRNEPLSKAKRSERISRYS